MVTKKTTKKVNAKKESSKPKLCQNCKYFFLKKLGAGICFRFPAVSKKSTNDWCGEHKFKGE